MTTTSDYYRDLLKLGSVPPAVSARSFSDDVLGDYLVLDGTNDDNDNLTTEDNMLFVFGNDGADVLTVAQLTVKDTVEDGTFAQVILFGGDGRDTFAIAPTDTDGFRENATVLVADFQDGTDLIDLTALGYNYYEELDIAYFSEGESKGVMIDLGNSAALSGYDAQLAIYFEDDGDTTIDVTDFFGLTSDGSGDGDDEGGDNADSLEGGDGFDWLTGGHGNDTIHAGDGNDIVFGGQTISDPNDGDDEIIGGGGDDAILGNGGNDLIYLDDETEDTIDGDDNAFGGRGSDTIYGGGGNDLIAGGGGLVHPSDEADSLIGGSGGDILIGNGGNDTLIAGEDEDDTGDTESNYLFGGLGADSIIGAGGDDFISGQLDDDILTGNGGSDTFVFFGNSGDDIITDFGAEDTIIIASSANGVDSFDDLNPRMVSGMLMLTLNENSHIFLQGVTDLDDSSVIIDNSGTAEIVDNLLELYDSLGLDFS